VAGQRYLDPLWHKDLVAHLGPLRDFTLAAPRRPAPGTDHPVLRIESEAIEGRLAHLDLPPCEGTLSTLRSLPTILGRLWKAVGEADIVHAGVGGWPVSFAWFAIPIARLRRKYSVTVVESSYRFDLRRPWCLKAFTRALLFEILGRCAVNLSDLTICTHSGYRDSMMLPWRRQRGHVFVASWIDRALILPPEVAESGWSARLEDPTRPLRVVLAANLLPGKGVGVLLEALRLLDARGLAVAVQVYGAGPMLETCMEAAAQLRGSVSLEVCGVLPYGPPFFEMLDRQDLMVIPSLNDEQPRIVFDCYARALPIIASGTPGLRQCVEDGETGRLVPPGDPAALAEAIAWASAHREPLRELGLGGLAVARETTIERLHERRAELILHAYERHKNKK
jgi:glycosyltransferase involved in cell wall biosynthesis